MIEKIIPRPLQHWRIVAKIFVILNAFTWSNLMFFAPGSMTYQISHDNHGGNWPGLILVTGMVILTIELFFTDHRIKTQSFLSQRVVPFLYMVMGGAYFVFAYMSTLKDGTEIITTSAVIQSLMCGAVAMLQKMQATHPEEL